MSPTSSSNTRTSPRRAPASASKKCSGPCGRTLPLSAFGIRQKSRDGRFTICKECRRVARGARSAEGQRARSLEKELQALYGAYDVPSLRDILNRALEEVRHVGAPAPTFNEQIEAVRRAVVLNGCRSAEEVVDDTNISRKVVDRALEKLVADRVLEPRDRFCLEEDASEPGRPVTEYHPVDTPRGEVFTHILYRAVDDGLL